MAMPDALVADLIFVACGLVVVGGAIVGFIEGWGIGSLVAGLMALGIPIRSVFEYPLAGAKISLKTIAICCKRALECTDKIRENQKRYTSRASI